LASLAVLIPCWWQPRIQAGDLSSHIYNSWLAQLVETRHLQGLIVAGQATNVLFDLILGGLFRSLGADMAQGLAVSAAVLVFVWGAFAFATAAAGRKAWVVLPCIAMLAYGWVFHMGFFDFYLGLGLCFWGLAIAWDLTPRSLAFAAPCFILAFLAHALAFAWGAAILGYVAAAKTLGPTRRMQLILGALGALVLARMIVSSAWHTFWLPGQIQLITGADQLQIFDGKYTIVFFALIAVWVLVFATLARKPGLSVSSVNLPLQLAILCAAGTVLLPEGIAIPGYRHTLAFIPERMSLTVAICLCAALASARFRPLHHWAIGAVTLAFFFLLFHDESALNAFESRIGAIIAPLPPEQRVLLGLDDDSLTRVNAVTHMIDRQCIGRCFSYANYEPSTWQFRVRATRPNPYVASTYMDSSMMQSGNYQVKPSDLPLYEVSMDNSGNVILLRVPAGVRSGMRFTRVLTPLF
jgi:hypothetical protein